MASQSSNLYDVNLLASVSVPPHKPDVSRVLALARPESLCVVVDNTVHLTANAEPANALATAFEFESVIDAVGWSDDGVLLVTGDRGGVLHFICPSMEEVIYSQEKLAAKGDSEGAIFKEIQFTKTSSEGESDLLILSSDGTVFIFENIHLERLTSALSQGGTQALAQFQSVTKLTKLDVRAVHDVCASFLLPLSTPPSIITTGRGSTAVCVWQKCTQECYTAHDGISYIMQGTEVLKCVVTSDGSFLVTLTDSHMVAVWLLSSLIMVNLWTGDVVKDLTLCQSASSCSGGGHHSGSSCPDRLCLVTEDTSGQRALTVVSLPGMNTVYCMEMSPGAVICSGYVTEESLYFVDISCQSLEKPCIQIKHLVQALPENRMATLLAQHKFEEAEMFANKFKLDLELVYKRKAQVLNDSLVRASSREKKEEDEQEEGESVGLRDSLLHCLNKIKDESFVADLVLSSPYSSIHMTLKMLHYTKTRLQQLLSSRNNDTKALRVKVCTALDKLTTFQMILGRKSFSSESWHSFLESSLLEELQLHLQLGNLPAASCIWIRHQADFLSELDSNNLLPLVTSIPESVPSSQLTQWLTGNIVPFLLQHTQESLGDFLSWVEQRARILELTEKEFWPTNALDMVTSVLESLHSFRNRATRMCIQAHTAVITAMDATGDNSSSLAGLRALQRTLTDMQYIHSSLQCLICLSDYEKESREVVVFRLLDKIVATELVSPTVQSKVLPYVQRHGLKVDEVLLQYVKLFLSSAPRYSAGLSDSPWEAKAIAVIQTIKDEEFRVTGCTDLLKHIHPPWTESVESLIRECLDVDHPNVAELQKQYKLLQLKKMLHGYGVRDFNFSDDSKGRLYFRRILVHGGAKCLVDALQAAEMYQLSTSQVYKHHLMNLGLQDNISNVKIEHSLSSLRLQEAQWQVCLLESMFDIASEMMRGLSREDQITVAQKSFGLAFSKLQLPFSAKLDDPKEYIGSSRVALVCLKVLKRNLRGDDVCSLCGDWCSIEEKIQLFERLLGLQVEFSKFLTPQTLANTRKCKEMFQEKVQEFLTQQSSETSSKHYHNAVRFCHLLGYSEDKLLSEMVRTCVRQSQAGTANDVCWTLVEYSPNPSTARLLLSTVQEMWKRMERDPSSVSRDEVPFSYEISAVAAFACRPDNLLESLEVCQLSSLVQTIHRQCEGGGESGEMEEEASHLDEHSPLVRWSWSPRFVEGGLVLDRFSVMAETAHYALARMPPEGDGGGCSQTLPRQVAFSGGGLQSLLGTASQLTQALQDNSHSQLALMCTMQTLWSYCRHTSLSGSESTAVDAVLQQGQAVLLEQFNTLLNKVLSSRRIDHDYALYLLLSLPEEHAVGKLQAIRSRSVSSYSKVIALCKLAIHYGRITEQPSVIELAEGILRSAEWGKKLSQYKISFTQAFRGGLEEKKNVVFEQFFRNTEMDLTLLIEYCQDFGINSKQVLTDYLTVVLIEWNSSCYQARAAAVIAHLHDLHVQLHQMLPELLMRRVTPYDHEKIAFVLQQLAGAEVTQFDVRAEQIGLHSIPQGLRLLDCLKHYTRLAAPLDHEKLWFAVNYTPQSDTTQEPSPSEVTLPDASRTRLPFHQLLYGGTSLALRIIGPEMSTETVEKLTPLAKILKLLFKGGVYFFLKAQRHQQWLDKIPDDEFFSMAIDYIVKPRTCSGNAIPSSVRFSEVAHLLDKICDYNLALTVAKWVAKQLQNGEDKLEALQKAVTIAQKEKESAQTEDEFKAAVKKVKMLQEMVRDSQTENVLREHDLDDPKYCDLCSESVTLIRKLYTDIPVSGKLGTPVHSVAAQIANIHNLNLQKLVRNLAETWLSSVASSKQDMDVTQMSMLEDPTKLNEEDEEESEDQVNMKRLIYLLNVPENLETHANILLKWAKRTSSPVSTTSLSRVRALQILFAIAPVHLIELVSGTTVSAIKDYMQRVLFVAELEALHMSSSLPAFQNCNKEGLVRSLWRNHAQEPRALRLICELCLHYKLFDGSLWSRILEQLFSMGMLPYLRHVLKTVASHAGRWNVPSLPAVWQKTILAPFQGAAAPLTASQKQECAESLELLYGCPFLFEVDVASLVRAFCDVELRAHALSAVLVITTPSERNRATQGILRDLNSPQYTALLDELLSSEEIHLRGAAELVYMYLNSTGQHETLLGSPHFTSYVTFLISRRLIDSLLTKTLQAKRVKEAIQLVEMYNSHHQCSQMKGMEALKEYVTSHELHLDIELLDLH